MKFKLKIDLNTGTAMEFYIEMNMKEFKTKLESINDDDLIRLDISLRTKSHDAKLERDNLMLIMVEKRAMFLKTLKNKLLEKTNEMDSDVKKCSNYSEQILKLDDLESKIVGNDYVRTLVCELLAKSDLTYRKISVDSTLSACNYLDISTKHYMVEQEFNRR